ncbi:MAG: hypothetical protein IKT00_14605 [Prevotella sp.]|nr:hypothetical protein [Prevotella sp.]
MPLYDHYYSLAALAFILSGLFFAAVRWFHVCRPYQQDPSYYFPARPLLTVFFILPAITFPYVLWPGDPDAWLLMKSYFPLTHMYICAVLMFNYFGSVKHWNKWKRSAILMAVPLILLLAFLLFNALSSQYSWGGRSQKALLIVTIGMGIIASVFSFVSLWKVMSWLRQLKSADFFSNPDDFPSAYAQKILFAPVFEFFVVWAVFFADSKKAMALMHLVFMVFNIWFLLTVLHSKREKTPTSMMLEMDSSSSEPSPELSSEKERMEPSELLDEKQEQQQESSTVVDQGGTGLSGKKVASIIREIRAFVEEEHQYLNPHLTINDVAGHCGYGRTYVSRVLSNEMGGFFQYVNTLRLQHAQKYREEHPNATQDEVAAASGFSSRQAFYAVRRRMN